MYQFELAQGMLVVRVTGQPTRDDLLDAAERARELVRGQPGHRVWDVRDATITMSAEDLREVARRSSRGDRGESRMAILAGDDLAFGLGRMYGVFRANDNVEVRVFRAMDDAMAWFADDA